MLRAALLASIVAFSASSFAGPVAVFKIEGLEVRAHQEPCEMPQVAQILAQFGPARKAVVMFEGREVRACYALQGDNVILLDEDGDAGAIPAASFKEARGV